MNRQDEQRGDESETETCEGTTHAFDDIVSACELPLSSFSHC